MSNTVASIYMSMPVPVPTHQTGPQYSTDINSCLTILDSHTHSSGSGQQITPQGLSINQDLPFSNNNATLIRSARFQAQQTPISQPTDLRCLYSSSADLYYNDSAGNQIRLTQNGGVAGTPGSIGGLLSPANVSYISGSQTFVFQSSTATPGNIDCGGITLREIVANSKGITIAPPAGLANNYSISLFPTLPVSGTKIITIDSSGNLNDTYDFDNVTIGLNGANLQVKNSSIGPQQLVAFNYAASSSCGDFQLFTSTTAVITNLSAAITTSGLRPIHITAIHDGTNAPARIQVSTNPISTGAQATILVMKDNVINAQYEPVELSVNATGIANGIINSSNLVDHYDLSPTSGTVTYSLRVSNNSQAVTINRWRLLVMEA